MLTLTDANYPEQTRSNNMGDAPTGGTLRPPALAISDRRMMATTFGLMAGLYRIRGEAPRKNWAASRPGTLADHSATLYRIKSF